MLRLKLFDAFIEISKFLFDYKKENIKDRKKFISYYVDMFNDLIMSMLYFSNSTELCEYSTKQV